MTFQGYRDLYFIQVKYWITLNEPFVVARFGYGTKAKAPGYGLKGTADYIAGHNLIRAHAKAHRLYERKWKPFQHGVYLK